MGYIVLLIIAAIVVWAIVAYNSLVRLRNEIDGSWRQIDVQLKRRHDLSPNLIEAVKGYMQYERDTLNQVVEARAKALTASDQGSRIAAENRGNSRFLTRSGPTSVSPVPAPPNQPTSARSQPCSGVTTVCSACSPPLTGGSLRSGAARE